MKPETFALMNESDRGCVIVGAVILENRLTDDLTSIFMLNSLSKRYISNMFDGNGALGNFSSKVLLARGIGLIKDEVFHDLMVIRKMRNEFAHTLNNISFSDPVVKARIDSMFFARRAKEKMKEIPAFNLSERGDGDVVFNYKSIFCIAVKDMEVYLLETRAIKAGCEV